MKKALSILLCLAMLVTTVPVSVFAAPSVSQTTDSVIEQNEDSALIAGEIFTISYSEGRNSALIAGKAHPNAQETDENGSVKVRTNTFLKRYESTKNGYVIDGWTDGLNVYAVGGTYTFTCDTTLTPNVVPEGDGYTVLFTVADEFKELYAGPAKIVVAVGEETSLSDAEFALSEKNGYIVKGWKKSGTDDAALLTSVTGVKDEVITLEAVCVRDVVDIVLENSTITENNGTLELTATVTRPQAPDAEFDRTVTWSIKEGGNKATLDGNKLTAIWNGTVVVTATPAFDATQAKDFEIVITGQEGYEVHYDKNTGAEVTGMPSFADGYDMAKATYTVSTDRPSRDGFIFDGWMLSPDADEVVGATINVTENTTLYARWMKGGYVTYFDEDNTAMNSTSTVLVLADGSQVSTDARYASDYAYDAENNVLSLTLGGSTGHAGDHRIQLNPNASLKVDVTKSNKIVLGFRTDAAGSLPFQFYYATKDADGNWIAENNNGGDSAKTNPYIANRVDVTITTSGDVNEVHELVLDMSTRKTQWTGILHHARFGNPDSKHEFTGKKMYYEYIKIIGAQTVETIDLTVDAPKTKEMAYGTDAVTANSSKYIAKSIEWQGELLAGKYYDSAKVYTAKVGIEALGAYTLSDAPVSAIVNGVDVTDTFEYVDGKAYVSYTFPATENMGVIETADIYLHTDDSDSYVTVQVFKNDENDPMSIEPSEIPEGSRWLGWSTTYGGEAVEVIQITDETAEEEKHFYALFEEIYGYDFSNEYHKSEETVAVSDATLSFDGAWAVVSPLSSNANATLTLSGMKVPGADYDFVEVTFDATLEDENADNKFSESLAPTFKVIGADGTAYASEVVSVERLVVNKRVAYKYKFDFSVGGKPDVISKFEICPYAGNPAWAVTSALFVENSNIEEVVDIKGVNAPKTWYQRDVSMTASENYEIVDGSIEWSSPDGWNVLDGEEYYKAETEYTITLVVEPVTGKKIVKSEATIDGEPADSAVIGADGRLTITKTFPATEALTSFNMTVADAVIDVVDGTVEMKVSFDTDIENKNVVWSITDNGANGNCAEIDDATGVVKAYFDGVITVRATSMYNPEQYTEATVTITNQVVSYTVTYDKGTLSENVIMSVTEEQAKLYHVLPKDITRAGFSFVGWAKVELDEDGNELPIDPTVTYSADVVTRPTKYVAVWVKGVHREFFDENEATVSANKKDSESYDYVNGTYSVTVNYQTDLQVFVYQNFVGKDYPVVQVRLKADRKLSGAKHKLFFTSIDADGNPLQKIEADNATYRLEVAGDVGPDGYTTLTFDMSGYPGWMNGTVTMIRLDPVDSAGSSTAGAEVIIDYIRAVDYEASEILISGVQTPVAKELALNEAVSDNAQMTVKSVAWEGELIGGRYFGNKNAEIAYTVAVTVEGAEGYFISDAPVAKIKIGDDYVDANATYNGDGTATLRYTFPAVARVDNDTTLSLTLVTDVANAQQETVNVFEGDSYAIGSHVPASVPAGKRWIGWSEEPDATENTVASSVVVTENATYYAVYEDLLEIDFANPAHRAGTKINVGSTIEYADGLAILTPADGSSTARLRTPEINLIGKDIAYVEVYYSATLTGVYDNLKYSNNFSNILSPALNFAISTNPDNYNYSGTLVASENVVLDGDSLQKYTYDMSGSTAWMSNTIANLVLSPYKGYPEWGVRLIRFVPATVAEAAPQFELEAPEAMYTPATAANVSVSGNYEITNVTWSPACSVFAPETTYSVAITYKATSGYKVQTLLATVNSDVVTANDNGNGTYTAGYTFASTSALKDVTVEIVGAKDITTTGRYLDLAASVKAVDGSELPITAVEWSIDNEVIADISENGRIYPVSNGTVTVTATSLYDTTKTASTVINISGQNELVTVSFDWNTTDTVDKAVPSSVQTYGTFVPEPMTATRDGFFLTGWATDPDAIYPEESFNITEDTILYAKWGKGYEWSFDSPSTTWDFVGSCKVPQGGYDTVNGTATIEYRNTASAVGQLIKVGNLARKFGFETASYDVLEMRLSIPVSTNFLCYYHTNNGESTYGSYGNTYRYDIPTVSATASGVFQTVRHDLGNHSRWIDYPYVNSIRLDIGTANKTSFDMVIDYIRILNEKRTVKFDGNGGYIPYLNGEVEIYKEEYSLGNIPLPADPTKEGSAFLGWAKSKTNYTKLYNGSFPVSDDVTLYAIWANITDTVSPDSTTEVTPTISVAESIDTAAVDSIVVNVSAADYASSSTSDVVLSYMVGGVTQTTVISSEVPAGDTTITVDFEALGITGVIENVEVVLPTGVVENLELSGVTINSATSSVLPYEVEVEVLPGGVETITSATYPSLGGGSVSNAPEATNTKTPADKTVDVPERPAEAIQKVESTTFPLLKLYDGRFTDVLTSNWFYQDVEKSYRLGLMKGISDTLFAPDGEVTVAEAITVAARMNERYYSRSIMSGAEGPWYTPYVNYAIEKGIITDGQFTDYKAAATREQVAQIFAKALPGEWYEQKNLFLTIPDVDANSAAFASIQLLYNAGVVIGVDDAYNFKPADTIKRSELSAIINRVALPDSRIRVITEDEMKAKIKTFTAKEIIEKTNIANCYDSKFVEKNGGAYAEPSKADPYIVGLQNFLGGTINTEEYTKITIVMKPDKPVSGRSQTFFANDGKYTEAQAVNVSVPEPAADGTVTFEIDMSSHEAWKGEMTTLRFDPYNDATPFAIISITFAP